MEEGPSESVGEASESVAATGDLSWTERSYSSSASLSGYAVPVSKAMVVLGKEGTKETEPRGKGRGSRLDPRERD